MKHFGLIDIDLFPVLNKTHIAEVLTSLFLLIFIIPIIEELIFRLHLLPRKLNISVSVIAIILYATVELSTSVKNNIAIGIIAFIGVAVLAVYFIFQQKYSEIIITIWKKKFRFVFYFTALLFGSFHLINHKVSGSILIFFPLIFAPQIILGINTGYLRVRSGFGWGLLLHIIHNFLFIGVLLYITNPDIYNLNKNEYIIDYPQKIKLRDDYTLIIDKEKEAILNYQKISPSEIKIENTSIKETFILLANAYKAMVLFENAQMADKSVNINFISRSSDKSTLRVKRHYLIQELLKKYKLKAQLYLIPEGQWVLFKKEGTDLSNSLSLNTGDEKTEYITLQDLSAQDLAGKIETLYSINCIAVANNSVKYNFNIPGNDIKTLQKTLEKYGFGFYKTKTKTEYFYISADH